MKLSNVISFTAAAVFSAAVIAGCSSDKKNSSSEPEIPAIEETTESEIETTTTIPIESYPDFPISYPEIEQQETGNVYEAEDAVFDTNLIVSAERWGYSGDGYVTGFGNDGKYSVTFNVEIPSNQHYDLSFTIASDYWVNCRVIAGGEEVSRFSTMSDGQFQKITIHGIFLGKGETTVEIVPEDGDIMLDRLHIDNNTSLEDISYDTEINISNENASESAEKLMNFLTENYGKYVITGQYASSPENKEIELIHRTTGKYPAIRFAVLDNGEAEAADYSEDIQACADWSEQGGIVGVMWQWRAPSDTPSVYANETNFSLYNAIDYNYDLAWASQEDIESLYENGLITDESYGIIKDIDEISESLLKLKEKDVPVLWRPLHEASLNWDKAEGCTYWWGASGADCYRWLWYLMYNRMTYYWELDNLIWVWNGMSDLYMVDKGTYDIASYDLYNGSEKEYGSRLEQFAAARSYVGSDKMLAISECDNIPDIDAIFRDNAIWSFFGLWYGNYIMDSEGNLSEEYTSKEKLVRAYNSDGAITLDKYIKLMNGGEISPAVTETETEHNADSEIISESENPEEVMIEF